MVLSDNSFPPDIRVEKEAGSLIRDGHKLYLIAKNSGNQKPRERVNGINIIRVKAPFQNVTILEYLFYFLVFRYMLVLTIVRQAKSHKIQALHVHDLPFAMAALMASKLVNVPVIFDMHEYYTEMIESVFKVQNRRVTLLQKLLGIEEKLVFKNVNKIIVVIEEQIPRILSLGISKDKIETISNTVDIDKLKKLDLEPQDRKEPGNGFVISYIGGFSGHRGLDTLIKALPIILKKAPEVKLLLVGDDPYRKKLKNLAMKLGVADKVLFTGWVPFPKAMSYIARSDMCAVPHLSTPQTEAAGPHKLFQYMYFSKPLLVSDVASLKRIVTKTKCGVVFKAGDHQDLASKFINSFKKPDELKIMGINGYKSVLKKYNWSHDAKKLKKLYESLGT